MVIYLSVLVLGQLGIVMVMVFDFRICGMGIFEKYLQTHLHHQHHNAYNDQLKHH